MKRTLVLDEDDLIMVVKEDVVKQIDEHRGELNRTEFVNYLIQCQLRNISEKKIYLTVDDFQSFALRLTGIVRQFTEEARESQGPVAAPSNVHESLDELETLLKSSPDPHHP